MRRIATVLHAFAFSSPISKPAFLFSSEKSNSKLHHQWSPQVIQRTSSIHAFHRSASTQLKTTTSSHNDIAFEEFEDSSNESIRKDQDLLNAQMDAFLRGEYDRPFDPDAPAPHPGLQPHDTVELALRALREVDLPEPSHGAAVLLRFCKPLSRGERWGGGGGLSAWKEVLRGAITPTMLARRLRASPFSVLLDWENLTVTEGYATTPTQATTTSNGPASLSAASFLGMKVAFVNAAMFFGDGVEPAMVQFTLREVGGVWWIEDAVLSKKELFVESGGNGGGIGGDIGTGELGKS